jgi:ribonucleoside-diphosphate reductase alpha chain
LGAVVVGSGKRKGRLLQGRYVRAHRRRHPEIPYEYVPVKAYQEKTDPTPAKHEAAKRQGELELIPSTAYEGDLCDNCGNFAMVRTGTSLKCEMCGSTKS